MDANSLPLLGALKSKMGWLNQRQKIVSENVANAQSPGFKPHDLKAQDFQTLLKQYRSQQSGAPHQMAGSDVSKVGLMRTQGGHIGSQPSGAGVAGKEVSLDSETTLDGNAVVLEEQMVKMAESRMQFEAAVAFYTKSLAMVRMASRRPGG
jgi:flagellar basal-body rod protein FlgB